MKRSYAVSLLTMKYILANEAINISADEKMKWKGIFGDKQRTSIIMI